MDTSVDAGRTVEEIAKSCEKLDALLADLARSRRDLPPKVKQIRKLGKTLRGGLGLLGLKKSAGREIQAIGRLLGSYRDAVSRCETWEALDWNTDPLAARAIRTLLAQQRQSSIHKPPARALAWSRQRVQAAASVLPALPLPGLNDRIAKSAEQLRQKMDKRCRRISHGSDDDFHEARKAIKAWLGACDCCGFKDDRTKPLKKLAKTLGDENDLATLGQWLAAHGFTEILVPDLWKLLQKKRAKLRRRAIKQALAITA